MDNCGGCDIPSILRLANDGGGSPTVFHIRRHPPAIIHRHDRQGCRRWLALCAVTMFAQTVSVDLDAMAKKAIAQQGVVGASVLVTIHLG